MSKKALGEQVVNKTQARLLGKCPRRFPLSHRYGCGWLSIMGVRKMGAGQNDSDFDNWLKETFKEQAGAGSFHGQKLHS